MKKRYSLLLVMLIVTSLYAVKPQKIQSIEPFLTLDAVAIEPIHFFHSVSNKPDYLHLLKQQLSRIGIDLKISILDPWDIKLGTIFGALRQYDIGCVSLGGKSSDPDFFHYLYHENGSLNIGYRTSMDWDDELNTGKNAWYMNTGKEMIPPYSQERIQHYWEWENYLMDEILPGQPLFSSYDYEILWDSLKGYNMTDGLLQSWGKMFWDGSHTGQTSTEEIVIADDSWENLLPISTDYVKYRLNYPIYLYDSPSMSIIRKCLDPLIWYDSDMSIWPHLAESITFLNDTHLRIKCREGITWDDDPDGMFTNELFDAHDVYFTLYCWQNMTRFHPYHWIESMNVVDDYTLDIHAKGADDYEYHSIPPSEFYSTLAIQILPEHYLNQTQLIDGITPDNTHSSWEKFSKHCFGTGLFRFDEFNEGINTILSVRPNSWWLNPAITNDPLLNWQQRFGDFSEPINQLRIRHIFENIDVFLEGYGRLDEFDSGKLDITPIPEEMNSPQEVIAFFEEFEIQKRLTWSFDYLIYNLFEISVLGSRVPCPNDPSITKGLAIRKAISYAMNRIEMNNIIHRGFYHINDHPIYERQSVWCNPSIIRYNQNLEKAWEYMEKADYRNPLATDENGINFYSIISLSIIGIVTLIIVRKRWVKRIE